MSSNAATTSQSGESAHDAERLPLNTEISAIPLDSSAANTLTADTLATDAKCALKLLRIRNIGRVIIQYLNINSVRNKFDALKEIAAQSLDVLMIAETKIDAAFPTGHFAIEGFATPFRLDRNAKWRLLTSLCPE